MVIGRKKSLGTFLWKWHFLTIPMCGCNGGGGCWRQSRKRTIWSRKETKRDNVTSLIKILWSTALSKNFLLSFFAFWVKGFIIIFLSQHFSNNSKALTVMRMRGREGRRKENVLLQMTTTMMTNCNWGENGMEKEWKLEIWSNNNMKYKLKYPFFTHSLSCLISLLLHSSLSSFHYCLPF